MSYELNFGLERQHKTHDTYIGQPSFDIKLIITKCYKTCKIKTDMISEKE